jgi:NitT/TauT family transport system substrate-binding protein
MRLFTPSLHLSNAKELGMYANKFQFLKKISAITVLFSCLLFSFSSSASDPLKIGYSDWPGYVAWQVAIDKGWFKEAGVDVKFEWFADYSASLEAYSTGNLDGITLTNGDSLVIASGGAKNTMILLLDYSDGNDMVVAKPNIKSLKDLKGKKVGLEVGFVEHLLFLKALEQAGMKETDVTLVNTKTNETPQALQSNDISAIVAWQPSSGEALKRVPGSKAIYTSANVPGLLYDVLSVNPSSMVSHKAEWVKVTKVWDRVVAYVNNPKTQPDAVKIMSARTGLTSEQYFPLLKGTHLFNLADGKKVVVKGNGLKSLYGSSKIADNFNVKYEVYKTPQDVEKAINPTLAY